MILKVLLQWTFCSIDGNFPFQADEWSTGWRRGHRGWCTGNVNWIVNVRQCGTCSIRMKMPDVHCKVFRARNSYACWFRSLYFHTCQTPRLDNWINSLASFESHLYRYQFYGIFRLFNYPNIQERRGCINTDVASSKIHLNCLHRCYISKAFTRMNENFN